MLIIFIIILSIIVCILKIYKNYVNIWQYTEKFPGPFAYPIIGNAFQVGLTPDEYLKTLLKWVKLYEFKTYRAWIGTTSYVVVSDAKEVETILSNTTLLNKGGVYDFLIPWLGRGLLISTGQKWFKHRKIITPSFHFQILNEFLIVMNSASDKFIQKLNLKSKNDQHFNVNTEIYKLTLDIICESAMGIKINSQDNINSEIVESFHTICTCISERLFDPIKQTNFGYSLTRDYWKERKALKVLKKCIVDVIQKRRECLKNSMKINQIDEIKLKDGEEYVRTKKPFLDNLLTATIDGESLSDTEIFEEVSTFMFEGHDTTASAIGFSLYNLSKNQEIQAKVFDEQKRIYGNNFIRDPTYNELNEMKYLELIIKETLRLYPSVPMIVRTSTELIELGDKKIPPNTNIVLFLMAMGYNENNFKNATKFYPERYELENRVDSNPFDAVPFSAGVRNCIGQKFAMLELKIVLSKIIRNFIILPPNENECGELIIAALITLKTVTGINIRLKKRYEN